MADAVTQGSVPVTTRGARLLARHGWLFVLAPGTLFLLIFFGYPLVTIAQRSLTDPGPSNYVQAVTDPVYQHVLMTTLKTAGITTIACLLLGYPYALVMTRSSRRLVALLTALVLLPFWSSLLVRTFSWTVLLQDTGLVNQVLQALGLTDEPLSMIRTSLGVEIGMVHILLPYMVLPLYATMSRIDPSYTAAAMSLGAPPRTAFRRVMLPLTLPGVYAGSVLVFVLSLGFYITPALLGNPASSMLGEVIVNQVSQFGFGLGGALGMVLLVVTLVALGLVALLVRMRATTTEEPS